MKRFLILILMVIALTACVTDPRKQAEADAIRLQAESQAEADAMELQHSDAEHAQAMAETLATAAERVAAKQRLILWTSITGAIALGLCILFVGYAITQTVRGVGQAVVTYAQRRAEVMANLVVLDSVTRQYPLLLHRLPDGKYSLSNPNTGGVVMLDMHRSEDRQMISTVGAVQFAGVVAQEARKSQDPTGMAMITAPIVGAEDKGSGLRVGLSEIFNISNSVEGE